MNIQTCAPTKLPQELKFGQSKSTAAAPEENATFGLDVVEFQSSQVKSDNDLYPGCSGELAMSGCGAGSIPCSLAATQVKADNDLYPGCTGELAMSGCMATSSARDVKAGDLDWQGVAFCSAAASDIESSFLAGNLHV